jgi:uncharacterized protein YdaU (DUF1376 family)
MANEPEPLIDEDIDIRDLNGFLLNVERLMASELTALASGDEFKAAVLLWCRAWKQIPAGSLPNDERILSSFSGAGRRWAKVRKMAMRGFILCSDNRYYHKVLCEDVKRAAAKKAERREQTKAATEARLAKLESRNVARHEKRNDSRNDSRNDGRNVERNEERNVVGGQSSVVENGGAHTSGNGNEPRNVDVTTDVTFNVTTDVTTSQGILREERKEDSLEKSNFDSSAARGAALVANARGVQNAVANLGRALSVNSPKVLTTEQRKQEWQHNIWLHLCRTRSENDVAKIIDSYAAGEPWGKQQFEEIDAEIKALKAAKSSC